MIYGACVYSVFIHSDSSRQNMLIAWLRHLPYTVKMWCLDLGWVSTLSPSAGHNLYFLQLTQLNPE